MKDSRLVRWDNAKALLICFVVLGHVANPFRRNSQVIAALQFWIYTFHMPAFVYIAGIFSKRTIRERRISRAFSYLLLYVLMELMMYLVNLYLKGFSGAKLDLLNENNVPWFALSMFWFLLITTLLQGVHPVLVTGLSIVFGLACGYSTLSGSFLSFARTIVFYPFFYLGFLSDPARCDKIFDRKAVAAAGAAILGLSFLYVYLDFDRVGIWRKLFRARYDYMQIDDTLWIFGCMWRFYAYMVSVLLTLAFLAAVPSRKTWFTKLGEKTLPVYAFHFSLMSLILYGIPGCKAWIAGGWVTVKCLLLSAVLVGLTQMTVFDRLLKKLMLLPEQIARRGKEMHI